MISAQGEISHADRELWGALVLGVTVPGRGFATEATGVGHLHRQLQRSGLWSAMEPVEGAAGHGQTRSPGGEEHLHFPALVLAPSWKMEMSF